MNALRGIHDIKRAVAVVDGARRANTAERDEDVVLHEKVVEGRRELAVVEFAHIVLKRIYDFSLAAVQYVVGAESTHHRVVALVVGSSGSNFIDEDVGSTLNRFTEGTEGGRTRAVFIATHLLLADLVPVVLCDLLKSSGLIRAGKAGSGRVRRRHCVSGV